MQEIQHVEHLPRPSQHLVLGELALGPQLVEHMLQVAARDKLHHQVMARVLGEVIDQRRNPRMRQTREHVGLAREILDRFLLLDAVADDHLFDRHRPVRQPRVVGQVHAAHPAHAEHLLDAVATVEQMALGELLTRIHGDFLQPSLTSAHAAYWRARLEGMTAQEIGSTTSFKNVFPIITSSPDLISAGLPGDSRG